jgi:site-specific recombinase XerD
MKTEVITAILQQMAPHLEERQMAELKGTLYICLQDYEIQRKQTEITVYEDNASAYLRRFLLERGAAGLSQETLDNYKLTLDMFLQATNKPVTQYTDEDIICYLEVYRRVRKVSFARIKNMQSAMSSFFGWLCRRKYIPANPVAQMDSIKVPKKIKHPFTAEDMEILRINCKQLRDMAVLETLYSTAVRVSELAAMDRTDISFVNRDVTVTGKGNKQRETYINASMGVYLKMYLESRTDNNPALFVSLKAPHKRLSKRGIEALIKRIGIAAGVENVHPHRFRRTAATDLLRRGMPIEQVSKLLGHVKLDTTQIYCTVDQESVRMSHRRYCA